MFTHIVRFVLAFVLTAVVASSSAAKTVEACPTILDISIQRPPDMVGVTFSQTLPDLSGINGNAEFVILVNTKSEPLDIRMVYIREDGTCVTRNRTLLPNSREILPIHGNPDTGGMELSLVAGPINSSDYSSFFMEHSRYWGEGLSSGTNAQAAFGFTSSWEFAEGVTGGIWNEHITVVNPNSEPIVSDLEIVDQNGNRFRRSVPIPTGPGRVKINIGQLLDGRAMAHSTRVTGFNSRGISVPIAAEREITWNNRIDGHAETGQLPSANWYGAEGHKGVFSNYILIGNLTNTDAHVAVRFLYENGGDYSITLDVPRKSRATVEPPAELPNGSFGYQVTSTNHVALVVERAMYWGPNWEGGHVAAGTISSNEWLFPEGATGFFQDFMLLMNPDVNPASVTLTFHKEDGSIIEHAVSMAPLSRTTVPVNAIPGMESASFSTVITSSTRIVAERAMYFGPIVGGMWSGGHVSTGIPK